MSRFWPILTLAALGFLVLVPGGLILISTTHGLSSSDATVALAPLMNIPLDQAVNQPSAAVTVVIPHTEQWKRIRTEWGEPDFVVSAVSSDHLLAWCLADLGLEIKIYRQGSLVPAAASYLPYGYSGCGNGSLRFRVEPEADELRLSISKSGFLPLPAAGQLIVVADWWNTKDKIVGDALDSQLRPLAVAASLTGIILIAFAASFQWRRGLR